MAGFAQYRVTFYLFFISINFLASHLSLSRVPKSQLKINYGNKQKTFKYNWHDCTHMLIVKFNLLFLKFLQDNFIKLHFFVTNLAVKTLSYFEPFFFLNPSFKLFNVVETKRFFATNIFTLG